MKSNIKFSKEMSFEMIELKDTNDSLKKEIEALEKMIQETCGKIKGKE